MAKIENYEAGVISSSATLREIVSNLTQTGLLICLVVGPDHRLIGVVADGDVRRGLLAGHTLSSPVQSVMNRKFFSAPFETSDGALRVKCDEVGINSLPLIDTDGRLRGLFKRDIPERRGKYRNQIVLMAGGLGTRLGPITRETPKPMVLIAGKPMIQHLIESVRDEGFSDFAISVNHHAEQIERHFGDGQRFGVAIQYLREERPLGTAGSLSLLSPVPSEAVVVINADVLSTSKVTSLVDHHRAHDTDMTVGVKLIETRSPYGVVVTNGHRITELVEKPVRSELVIAGVYVLHPRVLDLIEKGAHLDMTDLISKVAQSGRASAYPIHEEWLDLGTPDNLSKAEDIISKHTS